MWTPSGCSESMLTLAINLSITFLNESVNCVAQKNVKIRLKKAPVPWAKTNVFKFIYFCSINMQIYNNKNKKEQ